MTSGQWLHSNSSRHGIKTLTNVTCSREPLEERNPAILHANVKPSPDRASIGRVMEFVEKIATKETEREKEKPLKRGSLSLKAHGKAEVNYVVPGRSRK